MYAATVIATLICSFRKPPSSRRSLRRTAAAVSLAVSSRWLHVAVQPEVVMHTKNDMHSWKQTPQALEAEWPCVPAEVSRSAFSSHSCLLYFNGVRVSLKRCPLTRQAPPLLCHKADTLETPT